MPPKRGSSKKPAKARTPTLIDGLTKEEMTKEQMEEYIVHLREELDREREERNYFQLERDKIHTFWQITKRQLEDVQADLKKHDNDIEEDEQHHQVEIKVYEQKIKHLLCEHQNMTSELKADVAVSTQALQKEQQQLERQLDDDKKAIMVQIQELDIENDIRELELKHDKEMTETRKSWEKKLTEIKAKYDAKTELLKQELENLRKYSISEREHFWSSHINSLIEDRNKAFSDASALVDDLKNDLDVNDKLKMEKTEASNKLDEKKRELAGLLQENKHLEVCVRKAKEEVAETEKNTKYTPKKEITVKVEQKKLDDLKREHETLEQKFSKLQIERDELYKSFSQNIETVQQKADLKNELLERKLQSLTERQEKTQAQLSSLLSAPDVDQTALSEIINKVGEEFDSLNNKIKNLQYEKALVSQARKDILLTYERTHGVPLEVLNGKPIVSRPTRETL